MASGQLDAAIGAELVAVTDRMRADGKLLLSDYFPGDENESKRQAIITNGFLPGEQKGRGMHVRLRQIPGTAEHEIMAVAAVIRDPGTSQTYIDTIADFVPTAGKSKGQEVKQFWQMYLTEGLLNNATEKIAAILSSGVRISVRHAKKGKQRKAKDTLQAVLDEFTLNVNNAPIDGVVTGSRGLKSLIQQACRQALVEGDWFGRTVWSTHQVGTYGAFDMPMTIQSISSQFIQPVRETQGMGIEAFYWVPDNNLISQIQKPTNKDVADIIKRFIQDKDVLNQLKKNKKALLDPALTLHIKHRPVDMNPFGTSFYKPALQSIAFKRALMGLDFVTFESLVNRIAIVQVGAGGEKSKYSDPNYAAERAFLMNQLISDPAPNMMFVWQGDDIKVTELGAHQALLSTVELHKLADAKVKLDLGVPEALLTGSTTDGKAAGWAATIGASAELAELQNSFVTGISSIAERIAQENGFEDVDLIAQFNSQAMADRTEEWNQARLDWQSGAISTTTYLSIRGMDPEAEFQQMCYEKGIEDPDSVNYADVFVPVQGMPGQGPAGAPPGQGPGKPAGQGRPPNSQQGKPAAAPTETKTPTENK